MPHRVFAYLLDHPHFCPYLYWAAFVFESLGVWAQSVVPESPTAIAAIIAGIIALVGAVGVQLDARHKRRMEMMRFEEEMRSLREGQEKTSRRQDLSERAIVHVRENQQKILKDVKGLELLRDVFGVGDLVENRPCILIVDDDPATLKQFAEFFKRNLDDPCILLASSIEQAMEEIKKMPHWIFTDLKIGGHSGLELIPQAKALDPDNKIVVVTGWHDPHQLAVATAMGVEVITKESLPQKIAPIIRRLQEEFGKPPASSDSIPVSGAAGIRPGIARDANGG